MDWIIESDKNNGYPYHAELKDIYFEPVKSSPYPSELFILSGKGAYPKLQRLNFLSRIVLNPCSFKNSRPSICVEISLPCIC